MLGTGIKFYAASSPPMSTCYKVFGSSLFKVYIYWCMEWIKLIICMMLDTGLAGRGSSVGCASAWYADGRGFDPYVRQHSFVEIGHKIISTAILSLPLIQEGQLSVTGERMCTKYW